MTSVRQPGPSAPRVGRAAACLRGRGRRRQGERGAALLVAMVAVAVLTALAVDLAYDARVSLRIAGNARDELRATYLAKSGVALSRLVLSFQQDIDGASQGVAGLAPGAGAAIPRLQLWKLVPVGSDLAANLFAERPAASGERRPSRLQQAAAAAAAANAPGAPAPAPARAGEGDGASPAGRPEVASGGFEAVIDDEQRKVNAQLDAQATSGLLGPQVEALYQLICDSRWDALFDREDENGLRVSRADLLVYLHDWVSTDERGSALAASFPATCVIQTAPSAFQPGFQDKNYAYDRGEDRYRTKNARMDSLDELFMVAGVTDAFMAAFGDALTVYLPREAQRNVNETDRARLVENARAVADPPSQPRLYDPAFGDELQKRVMQQTLGGMLAMTPADFGNLVQQSGVKVNMNKLSGTSTSNPFTGSSTVFRIRGVGRAGDVTKTLDAVVRFEKAQPGQLATVPGRLVHWGED